MAFFLSTNGQIHPYNFKYLEGEFEHVRLERTEIHSELSKKMPKKQTLAQKESFAINIMNHPVFSLSVNSSLVEIQKLMRDKKIRHIPLTDEQKFIGMISDRDLLKVEDSGTFIFLKAKNIMTTVVVLVEEETPVIHIARVLLEENLSALPVIDKSHKVVGMISRTDILKAVMNNRLY
ncbi:MAG: CBS domain-containing protein [Bacteriovorax sp.]|nr:CBS domain-containing protein [Bacteriovorax sp.]